MERNGECVHERIDDQRLVSVGAPAVRRRSRTRARRAGPRRRSGRRGAARLVVEAADRARRSFRRRSRADNSQRLRQAGCCAKARVSPRRRRALRTGSGGARRGGAIVSRPSRRSRGEQARRESRASASGAAAPPQSRAGRHARAGAHARGPARPSQGAPGTRRVQSGFPPSLRFVVQPGVPGAAADRLDDASQYSGEDHPLRSGARDFTASRICAGASSRAIGGFTRSSIPRSSTNR